jgi:hypothetical protein
LQSGDGVDYLLAPRATVDKVAEKVDVVGMTQSYNFKEKML